MSNNIRIAKNTVILYVRMLLMMAISLYTSRVILYALGEDDFGIYNVVGGVVAMFGLLSNSMCNAIGRFINVELGKGNPHKLNNVFCTSMNILLLIALIIMVFGEIIGLWYIENKMNLPKDRTTAAIWVFEFSLLTFLLTMISIPYTAVIMAHEKMSAFAYISIFEALMKLGIALLLTISSFDKLILYAFLMFVSSIIIRMIYGIYCARHFSETKYHLVLDKSLFKKMFVFAGWNFVDYGALLANHYGLDIIVNYFFGVAINAAKGIASQVNSAVSRFVSNFMQALSPQIYQSFSQNDFVSVHKLIVRGSKFSYFLMLLFVIPLAIEAEFILNLWLVYVPKYAIEFTRWTLIISLLGTLSNTLTTGIYASAKLKRFTLTVGFISVLNLPAIVIVLKIIDAPQILYYVWFINTLILTIVRLLVVSKEINLSIRYFAQQVYKPTFMVTLVSVIPILIIGYNYNDSTIRFFVVLFLSIAIILISIFSIGITREERTWVINNARQLIKKRK